MTTDTITEYETTEKRVEVLVCDKCGGHTPEADAEGWSKSKPAICDERGHWLYDNRGTEHLCPGCYDLWREERGWSEGEELLADARETASLRLRLLRAFVDQWIDPWVPLYYVVAAGLSAIPVMFGFIALHSLSVAVGIPGTPVTPDGKVWALAAAWILASFMVLVTIAMEAAAE